MRSSCYPPAALRKGDEDYAVAFAIPTDTPGLIHVVGRSTLDTREWTVAILATSDILKYCPTVIFNNVFVPWERVFMCGEVEFAAEMVSRFSAFHRQSHGGCKAGKIDCMVGAGANHDGLQRSAKAGHLKQKAIDMIHRAETLDGCSLAASYEGKRESSGTYLFDPVLANASKIHEGKEMSEAGRLLADIAGGYVADLPSDRDLANPEIGPLLKKYLQGASVSPRKIVSKCFDWWKS